MPFWRDLIEGFKYVRNRPRVSSLLLLGAVNSLFGAPYFSWCRSMRATSFILVKRVWR